MLTRSAHGPTNKKTQQDELESMWCGAYSGRYSFAMAHKNTSKRSRQMRPGRSKQWPGMRWIILFRPQLLFLFLILLLHT